MTPLCVVLGRDEILILRNCESNSTSKNNFKYPSSGVVEAPDWEPSPTCGGGLHGLPWGVGTTQWFYTGEDCKWLVIKVDTSPDNYVVIDDEKCKFRKGEVVYCGTREEAVKLIQEYASKGLRINYSVQVTSASKQDLVGGEGSTLTAGYNSTLKAGYNSTLTAGDSSTLTAGDSSTLTAGDSSTLTAGYNSTLTAGKGSVLICRWYDWEWKTSCKVLTDEEAGKTFGFEKGVWIEIKKEVS